MSPNGKVFGRLICPDLILVQYGDLPLSKVVISPSIQVFLCYSGEGLQFSWCFATFPFRFFLSGLAAVLVCLLFLVDYYYTPG